MNWVRSLTPLVSNQHDLGATDRKGRAVGFDVDIYQCKWTRRAHSIKRHIKVFDRPQAAYMMMTGMTRDGRPFGGDSIELYHDSLDELRAIAARRLEGAVVRHTRSTT